MPKYSCYRKGCSRIRSEFNIFGNRRRFPRFDGNTFCSASCLKMHMEEGLSVKWRRQQLEKAQTIPRPKLGTILMQTAFVTRAQLEEAVEHQKRSQEGRIGEWLCRLGFAEEHQITEALARQYGLPLINLRKSIANEDAVRMIPGKVAKCSRLIPVGFDDDQSALRVAVCGPVNFNSQEAIRRMVRKGIVAYISDQSAIQELLHKHYDPEDLDLNNVPTFKSLEGLIEAGNEMVDRAVELRAQNIQAELVQEFFWVRLDFPSESHHHLFRYVSESAHDSALAPESVMGESYANAS